MAAAGLSSSNAALACSDAFPIYLEPQYSSTSPDDDYRLNDGFGNFPFRGFCPN